MHHYHGDADTACLIRIAIHGNMEFLKKYGKSGNDTEKKINDPSKERNDSSSA